jgi:hypothetical protein
MRKMFILAVSLSIVSCVQPLSSLPVFGESAALRLPISISKPFASDNLTVFLIKGSDNLKNQNTVTLQEALAEKKVRVRETGDVNNLTIENLSDTLVFIQSGDIVKGGRQDRTMQYDMILPPHSGIVPLPAFCVEHGRWQGRSGESAGGFATSNNGLVGKELKMAARKQGDQQQVWDKVAEGTRDMYKQVAAALPAPPLAEREFAAQNASGSLELALENNKVNEAVEQQMKKLVHVVDGDRNVIGFAFAINGKLNSADVYGSNKLFLKMWPKELKSAVAEAVQQKNGKVRNVEPTAASVQSALARAEQARISKKPTSNACTQLLDHEDKDSVLFDTVEKNSGDLVHRSYFAK